MRIRVAAEDVRPGMIIETWFSRESNHKDFTHRIKSIEPYQGSLDFILGTLKFEGTLTGMSLQAGERFYIHMDECEEADALIEKDRLRVLQHDNEVLGIVDE